MEDLIELDEIGKAHRVGDDIDNRDEGVTVLLVAHDLGIAAHAQGAFRIQDGVIEREAQAAPSAWPAGRAS